MGRERERQPQDRGQLSAEETRAENPDRHIEPRAGNRLEALARLGRAEVLHQFDDVLRELVGAGEQVAPHRAHRQLVGTRRAAQAELDSMIPPAPIAMLLVPAAICASATAVAALAMPGRL